MQIYTENQCKVAYHTFGSFPGKSPKQSELILPCFVGGLAGLSLKTRKVYVSHILRRFLAKEGAFEICSFCLIRTKEPCVRKFEGFTLRKFLEFCKLGLAYAEMKPWNERLPSD